MKYYRPGSFSPKAVGLYWAPLVGWMVAIFVLSSLTAATIESAAPAAAATRSFPSLANQVTAHLIEFGVLAALVYRVITLYGPTAALYQWMVPLAVSIAYGATDEFHQSFVAGRHASWLDVGYDAAGAVTGVAVVKAWSRIWTSVRGLWR